MSDTVLIEISRQMPFAVLLFGAILVFLRHLERKDDKYMAHEKDMETMRITAAKEREADRRAYDLQIQNMWAVSIKNIVDQQDKTSQSLAQQQERTAKLIVDALGDHEQKSKERYEKMGITQDLFDAAKDSLKKK